MVIEADEGLGSGKSNFDVLMNAAGELIFAFQATEDVVEKPNLIYDGRKRALLLKNKDSQPVVFSPIPREAWNALLKATDVLCMEIAEEKIVQEYSVPCEVKK